MAKLRNTSAQKHYKTFKGTSQGRNPIKSTMNKVKRRQFKAYRGQGK